MVGFLDVRCKPSDDDEDDDEEEDEDERLTPAASFEGSIVTVLENWEELFFAVFFGVGDPPHGVARRRLFVGRGGVARTAELRRRRGGGVTVRGGLAAALLQAFQRC